MRKRNRMNRRKSRRVFRKGNRVHKRNSINFNPMRGGIRL